MELPLRVPQPDGGIKKTVKSTAINWPWDMLNWLHVHDKLFSWASNNTDKVSQEAKEYWDRLSGEESVQMLQLEEPERTLPVYWHADGVRVYKQQKCWIYSFGCALKKGPSLSSKLFMLLVRENLVWKPFTHDRIAELIGWIQGVLQRGVFPEHDFEGNAWPRGSPEAEKANRPFAGGYKLAFSGFKGDWEARVLLHKLPRSYNHNYICEHCPASKLSGAFNYRNFAPDAPYLQAQFTHNQYLLMTPPELRSSWTHVPGWTKDRNLEVPCLFFVYCLYTV